MDRSKLTKTWIEMNKHSDRSRLRKDGSTDKNCRSSRKKRIEIKSGSIEVDERWIDKQKNGSTRTKKLDRQTKNWIEPKKWTTIDLDRNTETGSTDEKTGSNQKL